MVMRENIVPGGVRTMVAARAHAPQSQNVDRRVKSTPTSLTLHPTGVWCKWLVPGFTPQAKF